MRKRTSQDQFVVRSRRMFIYTFLLILIFMYISAKVEMRKMQAGGDGPAGVETEVEVVDGQEAGQQKPDRQELTEEDGSVVEELSSGMVDASGKEPASGKEDAAEKEVADEVGIANGNIAGQTAKTTDSASAEGSGLAENSDAAGVSGADSSTNAQMDSQTAPTVASPVIKSEDMWALILTNARYPIPEDYTAELKVLPGTEQSVDARIYDATVAMLSDMKEQGLRPVVCSAYRTLDRQEILFNRKVKYYVKRGYSMEDAYKEAQRVLSIPGSGEHCLGLAIDVCSQNYQRLEVGFEKTKEGKWLREHCAEYGFILRYEKGKEEITGIDYEPWHFRYVGVEVAKYMMEKGITLEEFYIEESLYG